jgi:hypothetical protein
VASDPSAPLRNLSALEEAEERAFRRGEQSARLKGDVASHERRLNAMNGSIDRLTTAVGDLGKEFHESLAVAAARADEAKKAAEKAEAKGLSTRTFVVSLVVACAAVCGVIVTVLALILH